MFFSKFWAVQIIVSVLFSHTKVFAVSTVFSNMKMSKLVQAILKEILKFLKSIFVKWLVEEKRKKKCSVI